jgi:NADH-quinone oxidoreductase subunit C
LLESLPAAFGSLAQSAIENITQAHGEVTVLCRREHLPEVLIALRQNLAFNLSLGVSGVHYPNDHGRELHAVYHLVATGRGSQQIRVETTAPQDDPHIPSTVNIFPTHNWHERETFDMLGIEFDGHPALARILLPDDWQGHPLRKDYPLGGVDVQFRDTKVPSVDQRRTGQ